MKKKYEAMVLSCMDPRFQKPVHKYLDKKKLTRKFSAFTIAGGLKHSLDRYTGSKRSAAVVLVLPRLVDSRSLNEDPYG